MYTQLQCHTYICRKLCLLTRVFINYFINYLKPYLLRCVVSCSLTNLPETPGGLDTSYWFALGSPRAQTVTQQIQISALVYIAEIH